MPGYGVRNGRRGDGDRVDISTDFSINAGNADVDLSFGSTGDAYDDAHAYLFEFIEIFYNRQRHQQP